MEMTTNSKLAFEIARDIVKVAHTATQTGDMVCQVLDQVAKMAREGQPIDGQELDGHVRTLRGQLAIQRRELETLEQRLRTGL
jgi:hypothetical protein